jgi:fatty-acyl-CoA synthase
LIEAEEDGMRGLMMDVPLLVSSLIRHADRCHGDTEIVTRTVEGPIHRTTYREAHRRARRLAAALSALGVRPGERVGTLAWNTFRHLEIYYAVSGMGAVCHTINPRLFPEQIAYIVNHAEDAVLCFDTTFAPLVEKLAPALTGVRRFVALADRAAGAIPRLAAYEELLAGARDDFEWPELDERTASSLCYTSGTTGNPKGVLYEHRSTVLHSFASALPDALGLSAREVVLPVVPMFHVNAWGLPYACALTGAKLVLPGPRLDGAGLYELFETEGVTVSAGVPTVWMGLLAYLREQRLRFSTLRRVVVGGSAAAPSLIRAFQDEFGVQVLHAWGMTEMSPIGTAGTLKAKDLRRPAQEQLALQAKQGRAIYGVELKIVDAEGRDLPWDGKTSGELLVRGPWILNEYFKGEGGPPLRGGWFPTGDVATIDPDGYMQITDRSKDVIKSGGEWISSIDLENIAVAHPAVAEAAVVAARHPKWDERPLLLVVLRAGARPTREELLAFYDGKVARWWVPDDVVFVDQLPHTATGKLQKTKLREQYRDHRWPKV